MGADQAVNVTGDNGWFTVSGGVYSISFGGSSMGQFYVKSFESDGVVTPQSVPEANSLLLLTFSLIGLLR